MKVLTNTTNSELRIQYLGVEYVLEANGKLEVSKEVADFWVKLHGFLEVSEVPQKIKKEEVEAITKEVTSEKKVSKKTK